MTEPATPQPPTAPPVSGTITIPALPPRHAPQVPPTVQAIDHLGEIIAVAIAGYLCAHGKMSAEMFMGFSIMVLGIQTGIRGIARGRSGPPPSGLVGLAFLAFGAHALHRVIGLGALGSMLALALTGCSGSWEQRAHRALIVTAHVVSATDTVAAARYQSDVAGQTGAAFQRTDDAYRRVQGAESVIAATLVRAETLLADLQAAHGTPPAQARCLEVRAMLSLLSNLDVLRGALDLAGITVPPETLRAEAALAVAAEEMVPACEGADAGGDVEVDAATEGG